MLLKQIMRLFNVYLNVINKNAPIKTKVISGNQAPISQRHIGKQSWEDLKQNIYLKNSHKFKL